MNVLKAEKKLAVISALTEGCSIRSICPHDRRTQENDHEAPGRGRNPLSADDG